LVAIEAVVAVGVIGPEGTGPLAAAQNALDDFIATRITVRECLRLFWFYFVVTHATNTSLPFCISVSIMSTEHYFSSTPGSDFKPKEIQVSLAGETVTVQTSGGIFSPDHVDTGTGILLEHIDQAPTSGNLLDIGCGWGPIALSLAKHSPDAQIWAIDVNERSLELTKANAKRLGLTNVHVCKPEEVPADIEFTGIWSNPPIRVGKEILHGLMLAWLPRLAKAAEAYLVVQKNLGADSLQKWLEVTLPANFDTKRVDTAKSFRVIRVKNGA
jgi:16S rRNA G1207 methylase RsmC